MAFSVATSLSADGRTLIVRPAGFLDASAMEDFEEALIPALGKEEVKNIVVDGEKWDYLASAGMRVLLRAVKMVDAKKGKIFHVNLKDEVATALRLVGFMKYMTGGESVESCLLLLRVPSA